MNFEAIREGLARILSQDLVAISIVGLLLVIQAVVWARARNQCREPLRSARRALHALSDRIADDRSTLARIKDALHRSYPRLQEVWRNVSETEDRLEFRKGTDIAAAFASDSVLPSAYNWRLDAAAPGLFTGIGILGTFIGLILGFLRVNPEAASESVSPLLGGMMVAFLNSAVGVFISLQWAWSARVARHSFDNAADELIRALRRRLEAKSNEELLLNHLGVITERLTELGTATAESSDRLSGVLGARLEQAFSSLVNAPFEQLTGSVQAFEAAMRESGAQQSAMQAKLNASALAMGEAHDRLADVIQEVRKVLSDLALAGRGLQEVVVAAQAPVQRASEVAERTGALVAKLDQSADRQEVLTNALVDASTAMAATSTGLGERAGEYAAATGRLEAAVATIQQATSRAVEASVSAAREELLVAITSLRDGLQIETIRTIKAYEEATGRVVEAVDAKMTDLTERLSGELATLTSRLPAEVEQVHSAMKLFREQIAGALRSIDEAVKQLRQEAPAVLGRQLDQYDDALAKSIDHFNGTLVNWNANVEAIGGLARELHSLTSALPRRDGTGVRTGRDQ